MGKVSYSVIVLGIIATLGIGLYVYRDMLIRQLFKPTESAKSIAGVQELEPEVIATDLMVPWEIAFLPSGEMLVTERPGQVRLLSTDGTKNLILLSDIGTHRGEAGLLGLVVHPQFADVGWVYIYFSEEGADGTFTNAVRRYWFAENELLQPETIIEGIPGARYHDGGRIAFGPDGFLYIATGDAGDERLAQDTDSLAGKILRVTETGRIPEDNPFGNAVYSYGHRNVQGLTWDEDGQLWATEHGRSGVRSGFDEVNRIVSGTNYGWPDIQGDEIHEGMQSPFVHSGASETWAPSGMTYLDGHIVFVGLRGESLYSFSLSEDSTQDVHAHLAGLYGRLRTVVLGPDRMLYVATNNRDGRGSARDGDDKIIRINPQQLFSE